jgi:hypothetical protein
MPPDDPDDPIWGKEPEPPPPKTVGAAVPKMFTSVGNNSGLVFRAARLPDPTTIPPRQWLYGTQLVRGSVSVLVAPGGVGKTAYSMGIGLALAANRQIFDEKIFQQVNVAVLNLEEPMDELERRLAALMIHHAIDREAVERRYFLYSGDDRRITIAAMSTDGFDIVFPDAEAMIREIQAHEIGVLVVDPFAESHALEENSNSEMIKAAAAWRRIARGTGCAILLIHHVRKGAVTDIDAARGAKALTDSARVGLLLSAMTSEEATEFDVPDDERTRYVRLDDAKANMARKAGVARWFQLMTIELGNVTHQYPSGDRVAAIASWHPPSAMGNLTIFQCNQALDAIAKGPREGVFYTQSRVGKTTRWAGVVMIDLFGLTERRAGGVITTWVKSGVLEVRKYNDAEQRKECSGLFVVEARRPGTGVG